MTDILMNDTEQPCSINYRVIYNAGASKLAEHDIYTAIVESKGTYGLSRIVKLMEDRGCVANRSAIKLVLSEFAEVAADLVADGYTVNLPGLVRFSPTIRGTFASPDAPLDRNTNEVAVNAIIGNRMRQMTAQSSLTRINTVVMPKLKQVVDMTTQKLNMISSEGSFMVTGERLTWDINADDEGFFLNIGGEESKCTVLESEEPAAVLKTDQLFEMPGVPIELFFRTRIEGQLRQVKYDSAVVTAIAE